MDDSDDKYALQYACEDGDWDEVKRLVESTPKPPVRQLNDGLGSAAHFGHTETMRYLLDNGAKIEPVTPVIAAQSLSPAVYQVLLDYGWDINSKGSSGAPVLKHIVTDKALTEWFLRNGADPTLRGERNETALDTAAYSSSNIEALELLLSYGASLHESNALQAASRGEGGIPIMKYILDQGFDINALEHENSPEYFESMKQHGFGTALHAAAKIGSKERIEFLLERGADQNKKNTQGYTPAEWGKRFGKKQLFKGH